MDVAGDQVVKEMTEGTGHDLSRCSSTRTSSFSPGDDTSYCEPKCHCHVLPPVPGGCHVRTTETNEVSGMTSVESQSDSGIVLNISPSEAETASNSGMRSTSEPPPRPGVYDELTTPDYYNTKPNYYNISGAHNALNSAEQRSDSGIDLDISPSSYSRLRSSTREPPPPQVYDVLIKPDYYNVNGAHNATTGGIYDQLQ